MTGEELKNRVRAFLDEPVPDFWSDNEVYHALGEGAAALIEKSCAIYERGKWAESPVLRTLIVFVSEAGVSGGAVNLPPDFNRMVSVRFAAKSLNETDRLEAKIIEISEFTGSVTNPFLKDSRFVSEYQGVLRFSEPLQDGSYDLVYLKGAGAAGAAWVSPFDKFTEDLIVKHACASLILKDNKTEVSGYLMKDVVSALLQKGEN